LCGVLREFGGDAAFVIVGGNVERVCGAFA